MCNKKKAATKVLQSKRLGSFHFVNGFVAFDEMSFLDIILYTNDGFYSSLPAGLFCAGPSPQLKPPGRSSGSGL